MSKRITGGLFCLTSGVLFSLRYLSATIHVSAMGTWDKAIFSNSLAYVGTELLIVSIISLAVGMLYLVIAELDERKKK